LREIKAFLVDVFNFHGFRMLHAFLLVEVSNQVELLGLRESQLIYGLRDVELRVVVRHYFKDLVTLEPQ
jgi:hypothetical protein